MAKKKHLRFFVVMLTLVMMFALSTVAANAATRKSNSITVSGMSVPVGTVKNLGAKGKTMLSYKSSNPSIIGIDSKGNMTAKRNGTVTITVYAKATSKYNSLKKDVKVTAYTRASNAITSVSSLTVPTNTTKNLGAKGKSTLSYSSSNTAIATVDSKGNVKGIKAGEVTITIKAKATSKYNSLTKKVPVTIYVRDNNKIASVDSLSVPTGTTKSLSAKGKTTLSYSSSNKAIATVDSKGNVKGIKAGTATITIKAKATTKYNSLTKKVTVTVYDRADNSITCPDSLSIPWGTYKDLNATGKTTLSYSSSDTSVATVDSTGRVEGVKTGTATITVTAKATTKYNSLTKKVTVTVYTRQKNEITVSGADSNGVYHVTKGTTINMSAKGKTTLGYASEDTSIATVDSNGNVTGIAAGTTTIIISAQETDEYNYLAKEVTVVVTEPATPTPIPSEPEKPAEPETPTVTPTPLPTEPEKPVEPETPTATPTPVPVEPEEPAEPIVPETPKVVSTETVHHDAVTHTETVTIKEAWTEEVPKYEERPVIDGIYCNTCGEEMSSPDEHFIKTTDQFFAGEISEDEIHGGYHGKVVGSEKVQIGTETVTHPAETEVRTIVDQEAYDEVITTYSDGSKKTEKVACTH